MSPHHDLSAFAARLRTALSAGAWAEGEFEDFALELFQLHYRHNAPYRRLCERRGISPGGTSGWFEIPAVPASAFKELELSCLPAVERTRVFHSSGTTEKRPSRHFHNADSLKVYEESLWRWFEPHIPTAHTSNLLMVTPPRAQAPHSSLVHMFETIRKRMHFPEQVFTGYAIEDGGWSVDLDSTLKALRTVEETRKSIGILGSAFSFVQLLDELIERDLRLQVPAGSWALETGGYKGRSRALPKAELHALIERHLGISRSRIVSEYGMSELSSQAYDLNISGAENNTAQPARRFRFPSWARARVVSPEHEGEVADGETGLLRIFDLANVYSAMAIQTEDLATRRGNGFELIGRAARAEPRGCSLMSAPLD